jgi:histidyl-tRNA synthetase
MNTVSKDPYKGVRDFYPEDRRRQNYLFSVMKDTAKSFGYKEIAASVLEPAELFSAKSGAELAESQAYRFRDKADREVMLRPEMTPTTARMLAKKHKAMSFPVRWFSVPNVFRYEKPQRGRLREHWQFNADIFGIESELATVEMIELAHSLLSNFGATQNDFVIRVNDRTLFFDFCEKVLKITDDTAVALSKLLDKRQKITKDEYNQKLNGLLNEDQIEKTEQFLSQDLPEVADTFKPLTTNRLEAILNELENRDIGNAVYSSELMRGLDYYTGPIFEIFDNHPENNRSLVGGGRFDNLMEMFAEPSVPAVGFGVGDVTLSDFLDVHDLWPEFSTDTDVQIVLVDRDSHISYGQNVARKLRNIGHFANLNISGNSVGSQLKQADKAGVAHVVIIGDDEVENDTITVKTLETGTEETVRIDELVDFWD